MPPRKSGASTASATDANGDVSALSNVTNATASSSTHHAHPKSSRQSGGRQDDGVGIDDLLLPRSLISRLSRGVLPANTSLQKDAILALTRSATVFISYLAHHANEQSQLRHKKTLGVQDVMAALREIEFGNVMELGVVGKDGKNGGRLEREVEVYEEIIGRKRRGYREKVKARESGGAEGEGEREDMGEPSSKKIRRTSAEEEDEEERMLDQQLNGTTTSEEVPPAQKGKGKRKSGGNDGISVVVRNGKGKGKPDATQGEEEHVDEGRHGDVEEGDDGAEDDDQDEEDEQEDDDDDDDDDDEEEDEDEERDDEDDEAVRHHHHHDGDDDDNDDNDIDDSRLANGRSTGRVGLLPDGSVEIASEDESD